MMVHPPPPPGVVWVKLEKPFFDLWGVLVSSATLTAAAAACALVVGSLWGLVLIWRRRRPTPALELGLEADEQDAPGPPP
jgi:ABC-type nitrate/sulfonate/bicarbonate transport system permease component